MKNGKKDLDLAYEKIVMKLADTDLDTEDPLYLMAVECIREKGTYSISALQRRLRIGLSRAISIIERMKAEKILEENPAE